ncbi:hypothetical protein D6833_10100 [Candidatus Parcubacteria bacterium]|nr:MAG: hypothetical protein D6833_10100 [Candidatus Parcubacteria bacterium]
MAASPLQTDASFEIGDFETLDRDEADAVEVQAEAGSIPDQDGAFALRYLRRRILSPQSNPGG